MPHTNHTPTYDQVRGHLAAQLDPLQITSANIYATKIAGGMSSAERVLKKYKLGEF